MAYYDNDRPTLFTSTINIVNEDLNLNAIYQFDGLNNTSNSKLFVGMDNATDGYADDDQLVDSLGIRFNPSDFLSWNNRNNIYYKKIINIDIKESSEYVYGIVLNTHKINQYYGENYLIFNSN